MGKEGGCVGVVGVGVGVMPLGLVVAKLISYLIFITYLVSFRFHSRLAFILLDIYLLFVDKSVSISYAPYDSMLCTL